MYDKSKNLFKINSFQVRSEHVKRAVFILILAAFLFWYGIPWFYREEDRYIMPDLDTNGLKQQMYRSNGSLKFRNRQFYLNHRPIQILSGAMHYFRVPKFYWKDRLLKIKACGLNTVET